MLDKVVRLYIHIIVFCQDTAQLRTAIDSYNSKPPPPTHSRGGCDSQDGACISSAEREMLRLEEPAFDKVSHLFTSFYAERYRHPSLWVSLFGLM